MTDKIRTGQEISIPVEYEPGQLMGSLQSRGVSFGFRFLNQTKNQEDDRNSMCNVEVTDLSGYSVILPLRKIAFKVLEILLQPESHGYVDFRIANTKLKPYGIELSSEDLSNAIVSINRIRMLMKLSGTFLEAAKKGYVFLGEAERRYEAIEEIFKSNNIEGELIGSYQDYDYLFVDLDKYETPLFLRHKPGSEAANILIIRNKLSRKQILVDVFSTDMVVFSTMLDSVAKTGRTTFSVSEIFPGISTLRRRRRVAAVKRIYSDLRNRNHLIRCPRDCDFALPEEIIDIRHYDFEP